MKPSILLVICTLFPLSVWASLQTLPSATSVPTLNEFGLTVLAVGIALLGARLIRKIKK